MLCIDHFSCRTGMHRARSLRVQNDAPVVKALIVRTDLREMNDIMCPSTDARWVPSDAHLTPPSPASNNVHSYPAPSPNNVLRGSMFVIVSHAARFVTAALLRRLPCQPRSTDKSALRPDHPPYVTLRKTSPTHWQLPEILRPVCPVTALFPVAFRIMASIRKSCLHVLRIWSALVMKS
jgi:hypothetical protein